NNPQVILQQLWSSYQRRTPQRVKLIDVFMGFLVVVGALQFVYCVLVGNYVSFAFLFFFEGMGVGVMRVAWGGYSMDEKEEKAQHARSGKD
ncbi:MAG: hypothetical protein Q9199_008223, partial [Rusavskia elegans]